MDNIKYQVFNIVFDIVISEVRFKKAKRIGLLRHPEYTYVHITSIRIYFNII